MPPGCEKKRRCRTWLKFFASKRSPQFLISLSAPQNRCSSSASLIFLNSAAPFAQLLSLWMPLQSQIFFFLLWCYCFCPLRRSARRENKKSLLSSSLLIQRVHIENSLRSLSVLLHAAISNSNHLRHDSLSLCTLLLASAGSSSSSSSSFCSRSAAFAAAAYFICIARLPVTFFWPRSCLLPPRTHFSKNMLHHSAQFDFLLIHSQKKMIHLFIINFVLLLQKEICGHSFF